MKLYAVARVSGYYRDPFLEIYDIHDNLRKALKAIANKDNFEQGNWWIIEFVLNERYNFDFYERLYKKEPSYKINVTRDISVELYLHTEDQ